MKRKFSINKMAICLCLLLGFVFVVGCSGSSIRRINEESTVVGVRESKIKNYKYWVVTNNYNFYTNKLYNIHDTVRLVKQH